MRIDIMMNVQGTSPHQAWKTRKKGIYGKTPIHIINIDELIKAKRVAGRPQDKIDLQRLINRKKRFYRPSGARRVKTSRN